jgi:hypothetical protein
MAVDSAAGMQRYQTRPWLLQPLSEDDLWEDEAFLETPHQREEGFVFVDPHILCNPAIGDIDADGHDELVVAVSYFFDQEYYGDPVRLSDTCGPPAPCFSLLIKCYLARLTRGSDAWSV